MPTLGGAERAEILVPLPLGADAARIRNREDYNILAKLKPGVSIEQARADLATITARLVREHPDFYPPNGGLTFVALPLHVWTLISEADDASLGGPDDLVYRFRVDLDFTLL